MDEHQQVKIILDDLDIALNATTRARVKLSWLESEDYHPLYSRLFGINGALYNLIRDIKEVYEVGT